MKLRWVIILFHYLTAKQHHYCQHCCYTHVILMATQMCTCIQTDNYTPPLYETVAGHNFHHSPKATMTYIKHIASFQYHTSPAHLPPVVHALLVDHNFPPKNNVTSEDNNITSEDNNVTSEDNIMLHQKTTYNTYIIVRCSWQRHGWTFTDVCRLLEATKFWWLSITVR